jgi:hypothetical protein
MRRPQLGSGVWPPSRAPPWVRSAARPEGQNAEGQQSERPKVDRTPMAIVRTNPPWVVGATTLLLSSILTRSGMAKRVPRTLGSA